MSETETIDVLDNSTAKPQHQGNETLPNSGGILTMGILSIVFCGIVGLILGIIALSMSGTALDLYNANPGKYTEASYKNVKAGKTCAIVGLSLLGFILLIVIFVVIAAA